MAKSPKPTDVLVGTRIRFRRKELKISQKALGEALGVSFQQMQKYESGANRVGASSLYALAEALDVSVSYFFPSESSADTVSFGLLDLPGAVDLLNAYAAVSRDMQKAICSMATAAAREASGSKRKTAAAVQPHPK